MAPFLFRGLRALEPGPRRFLLFSSINVVSWQCLVGTALILFARTIDMPADWIGCLISFTPLTTVIVVFTTSLVERFGPRRLMMTTWVARSMAALPIFAMPWAIAAWGPRGGWYALAAGILGFNLARSFGVGGWFPWLLEIVPRRQQGAYFAAEMSVSQVVSVAMSVLVALMLTGAGTNELWRFYAVAALGVLAGLVSVLVMRWIPGGRSVPLHASRERGMRAYSAVLADRPFLVFILLASLGHSALAWLGTAQILYMRDALGFQNDSIMYLAAAGCLASAITTRFWGAYADHRGSGPAMILSLAACAAGALGWLVLRRGAVWTPALSLVLILVSAVFAAAFYSVANRGMLCRVRAKGQIGYTNLWLLISSLAQGVTPIMAGWIIARGSGIAGFQTCFVLAALSALVAGILLFYLPQEEGKAPQPELTMVLRPSHSLRVVGRIVWITLGLEERERTRTNPEKEQP